MKHIRRITLIAWIVNLVYLASSPAISQEANISIHPRQKLVKKYLPADPATIEMIKKMGRPLSPQEHTKLKSMRLKSVVDYSPLVTLVRDQGSTLACCSYTAAALVDILKERERPYTPDVSEGFIGYAYQESIQYWPDDTRFTIPADGQLGVVKNLGVVPETSLSSRNYDPAHYGPAPSPAEIPSNNDIEIAPLLRINDHWVRTFKKEDGLRPIKALLANGPLGVLYNAHCMALIGYDDTKKQFTFQNSYGEHGAERGFVSWTYDEMLNRLPDIWVTVVINAPTSPSAYTYTARIKLSTPQGRDNLTVKVGVEGQPAFTVWAPAPYGASDGGEALVMDVPLPDYAANHWPPNATNLWYLETSYPGQTGGIIQDVVLVKRGFKQGGTPLSFLYRSSASNFQISPDSPEKVYIPARVNQQLILSRNPSTMSAGQRVTFTGALLTHIAASSTKKVVIPIANQEILIYAVSSDPIEGTILERVIGRAKTDASGKYQILYAPSSSGRYRALASKSDGSIIATSNLVEVTVQ